MPQNEFVDTVADASERALDAVRTSTTRTIEGAGILPERVLVAWLRAVKAQAGRADVVGAAARGVLEAVHTPAGGAASFFTTIEKESSLPRPNSRRKAASARPGSRAATKRTGTTRTGTKRTGTEPSGVSRTSGGRVGTRRGASQTAQEAVLPVVVG